MRLRHCMLPRIVTLPSALGRRLILSATSLLMAAAVPSPADPAGSETPILVIDRANVARYTARLPEGALALFAKFPDYTVRVFPTHRTAAAPARVYANIAANASRAAAAPEGIASGIAGAAGGIPFPLPHNGTEIVWRRSSPPMSRAATEPFSKPRATRRSPISRITIRARRPTRSARIISRHAACKPRRPRAWAKPISPGSR